MALLGCVISACSGEPYGGGIFARERRAAIERDASGAMRDIHYIGRFDLSDPLAPRFGFPGSTIIARFSGTTLQAQFDDDGPNYFSVWIDGVEGPIVATAGPTTSTLATGLAPGEHTVMLVKRTETLFGITQFLGFRGATLIPTPPPYNRLIEMIGDSNTCGYGVLGTGDGSCPFTAETESEVHAWGFRAARALNAGHIVSAYSGAGVYRNHPDVMGLPLPATYDRIFCYDPTPVWDFHLIPDAVVVALGSNDYIKGNPGPPFVDAYDAFVRQLRGRYAQAHIVLAISPLHGDDDRVTVTQQIQDVIAAATARGDRNVAFLDIAQLDPADGLGCGYHPALITQQKMADSLIAHLRSRLGW